ncbi:DUF4347 domain-containing protein [Pseudomonas sp. ML96]|uniref:DUF4347 domain-containing protein n=1 Tax=Pseudomonas sp. ML96 TaxID=1523503 RepID=UPI0006910123|nr:DUF4347 domain-containing protein [Pseudomonas sp. ML96]
MKFLDLFKRQASPYTAKRAPLAAALEPRMLFDGAVAATAAEAASSAEHQTADPAKTQTADDSAPHASDAATPPAASSDQRQEIVFVDGKLQDAQQLIAGLPSGTEVVVLDSNKDGLQQIADYLKNRSDVDAIHLLSHGAEGTVELGNTWLNSQNIGQHAQQLNAIGAALATDGDILLYGCNTGEGAQGAALISKLARLTQADVAASDDATGAASKGGDWVLESHTGQVESQPLQVAAYDALLAAPADENYDDDVSGTVFNSNNFTLDGIRYVLTGTAGTYESMIGDGAVNPGVNNAMMFDFSDNNPIGIGGLNSVTISAADGSAFSLAGIKFLLYNTGDYGPSSSVTLTTNDGKTLGTFAPSSTGAGYSLNLSANSDAQYITSITFSGTNLLLEVDDLNFEAAVPPNAVPVATGNSYTVNEDSTLTVTTGSGVLANDTDADGDSLTAVLVTGPSHGSLTLNADGSFSYTPTANYSGADSFTYKANDGTADSSSVTVTLTVTAINDAPVVANPIPNQNASEGTAFNFQFAANTFSDVDAGATLSYSAQLTGGGALPAWLSFDPATRTFSGTPADSDVGTISIDIIASDGNGGTVTDTFNIATADTNATPVVTTSGGTTAFTEGDNVTSTPVTVDSGLTLADTDNATLASGKVSITGNLQTSQDVLAFTNNPATMGNISASYNSATGELTLTSAGASATLAQWQAALRSVTYSNSSDTPGTATRTISFVVNDGQSDSPTATKTVSVANINDAPQVTAPATISVSEDTPGAITGISFSDADAGSASVTVTLSVASGGLAATSGGGVTVGGTSSTMTLTGSIANINAFIGGSNVSFTTAANATGNVTLTASINDGGNTGSGGAQINSTTVTLQVAAVNDAPTISAPGSIAISEDVSGALTGISFSDVDAGSSTVTVTLSVASGSLAATSGSGVTVSGTASAMTLTGSIANINAFIAANGVHFTTAANATGNVVLDVTIDDGGNTGSGGNQTDHTTVTLTVTAVNDAPVNSVPGTQSVLQDGTLVFSSGNGNALSIADVDAGSGTVRVTLTASNGVLTLGSLSGVSFLVGNGTGDGTMTFEGTLSAINNALAGLSFSPTGGYYGPASVEITTDDLGQSGSGGGQTDTDTILINVAQPNPSVTGVAGGSPDGIYKAGDTVLINVTYDQAVTVSGGVPTLLLETGAIDRSAVYVGGSGTDTLTFAYVVQVGDQSSDLDYTGSAALSLNGATIASVSLGNPAFTTLPSVGSPDGLAGQSALIIDTAAPVVGSVSVPLAGTYVAGQALDFTVNFNETITVDTGAGIPRLAVTLDGGGVVYADYVSGSGSSALVFRLTLSSGQFDNNGISINGLQANGGTLKDAAGNDTVTTLNNVGSTSQVLVDAAGPEAGIALDGASPTSSSTLSFTVTFNEDVTGVDLADFTLATTGSASGTLQSLVQLDARTYRITVSGVSGQGNLGLALTANGSGIADGQGNTMATSASTAGYLIGGVATGDPEFRTTTPENRIPIPMPPLQPDVPDMAPPSQMDSLLVPLPLLDTPTVGSDFRPLSEIFLSQNSAQERSFIAQVFGSNDSYGDGTGTGFLGFGGGNGGVFGSSTLAGIFNDDGFKEAAPLKIFDRRSSDIEDGLPGIFGALSLSQQLHQLHEAEQQPQRELAWALGQLAQSKASV